MTYASAYSQKTQDVNANPTVVFQTKDVAVKLQSSASAPLDTGTVRYYAGGWQSFGTTVNGEVHKELYQHLYI